MDGTEKSDRTKSLALVGRGAKRASQDVTPRWVDENEAAEILGISVHTVRDWRAAGTRKKKRRKPDAPPFYKFGKSVRYKMADLIDWAENNRFTNTAQAG